MGKIISTETLAYVVEKIKTWVTAQITSLKGTANGLATLDSSGKVPSAQLPSYVDDVLEYTAKANFPATGETGKIYVDTTTNKTWRWSGTAYVEISASLALGETSATAYRGDRGKTAYDHSQATGNPHGLTSAQIAALGVKITDTTYSAATTSAQGLMSAADKTKLDGVAAGANNYTHPATSGNKHIPSGGASGQILRWSADGTAVWGADHNTTYAAATTSAQGLMSAADKTKLDGVAAGANNYTHPAHTAKSSGLYKVTIDAQGHVTAATAVTKADITALGIPAQDTTYTAITTAEIDAMF